MDSSVTYSVCLCPTFQSALRVFLYNAVILCQSFSIPQPLNTRPLPSYSPLLSVSAKTQFQSKYTKCAKQFFPTFHNKTIRKRAKNPLHKSSQK